MQRTRFKNKIFIILLVFLTFSLFITKNIRANNIDLEFPFMIESLNLIRPDIQYIQNNPNILISTNNYVLFNKQIDEESINKVAISINRKTKLLTIWSYNDEVNSYNIYYKTIRCSPNSIKTPRGLFHPLEFIRGFHKMFGNNNYCKYLVRFSGHFLIHSPIYKAKNNKSLDINTYNGLGLLESGGCVRITTRDAYFLYNHLTEESPIYIYDSDYVYPIPVIEISQISDYNIHMDPTNPNNDD